MHKFRRVKIPGDRLVKIDINKRKDKFQIAKIAKHQDPAGLIIANLSVNPDIRWTGDIISNKGLDVYKLWQKRMESLSYTFSEEIKKLNPDFDSNFKVIDYQHPFAFRLFLGEHISLETLVILNELVNFYPHWDKYMADDLVWKELRLQIPKYRSFLTIDKNKYKELVFKQFPR